MPLDALTKEEEAAIAVVRAAIPPKANEMFDDSMIFRFLAAKMDNKRGAFDLPLSIEMATKAAEYRLAEDLETIFQERFPAAFGEVYECGYGGRCRDGSILYVERPGKCNIPRMFDLFTDAALTRLHLVVVETGRRAYDRKHGGTGPGVTVVMDLDGLGYSHLDRRAYAYIAACSEIDKVVYPEHVVRAFIINAPWLFTGAWAMIKPFLDARTADKVQILGGGWRKTVDQFVDPAILPACISPGGPPLVHAFGSPDPAAPCRAPFRTDTPAGAAAAAAAGTGAAVGDALAAVPASESQAAPPPPEAAAAAAAAADKDGVEPPTPAPAEK